MIIEKDQNEAEKDVEIQDQVDNKSVSDINVSRIAN